MKLPQIQIRDPFILPVKETQTYYLFGTTDPNAWSGPATGFDCYRSRDLENWDGPIPAFRPAPDFWSKTQYWAPEVHALAGRYFMFATFKAPRRFRGTQILVADRPEGPFEPWSDGPVTPRHWECLDGTLHIDEAGDPWMIFCHEWVQVHDGGMHLMKLSADLRSAASRPVLLFNASEAPWVRRTEWPTGSKATEFPNYVTDGPFLFKTRDRSLLMLWSSTGAAGYAMGIARSSSGTLQGPWLHDPKPIWEQDGGHGMIFRAFDSRLFLTLHQPNKTRNERAILRELVEHDHTISVKAQ